jgi:hypothetical protein
MFFIFMCVCVCVYSCMRVGGIVHAVGVYLCVCLRVYVYIYMHIGGIVHAVGGQKDDTTAVMSMNTAICM